jgi:hypothetical protein
MNYTADGQSVLIIVKWFYSLQVRKTGFPFSIYAQAIATFMAFGATAYILGRRNDLQAYLLGLIFICIYIYPFELLSYGILEV